jgi:hypothetical protein
MGTMDNIIDKIADTTENMKDKVADKFGHSDDDAATAAPAGAHRGEAADEHKPGLMDKIADATEKLVEKYDHSDAPAGGPANPPVEIPAGGMNMDPTGKV